MSSPGQQGNSPTWPLLVFQELIFSLQYAILLQPNKWVYCPLHIKCYFTAFHSRKIWVLVLTFLPANQVTLEKSLNFWGCLPHTSGPNLNYYSIPKHFNLHLNNIFHFTRVFSMFLKCWPIYLALLGSTYTMKLELLFETHKPLNSMGDFQGSSRNMNTICVNGACVHFSPEVVILDPKLRTTVLK